MPAQLPCVLVVDDDPGIRGAIEAILTDEGYDVVTATHGREALECIAARPPALILLDLQMPVMTGQELIAELRQSGTRIPVIFMSAGLRARTEAQRHNADGHLSKPFEMDEILAVVARFCS